MNTSYFPKLNLEHKWNVHISPVNEKEKTNMVFDQECLLLGGEKFLQEDAEKAESLSPLDAVYLFN